MVEALELDRRLPVDLLLDEKPREVDRVADALSDGADDESGLYSEAQDRIESSARSSDLGDRAEDGTRDMLTTLAHSLGVDDVTVEFEAAPGASS